MSEPVRLRPSELPSTSRGGGACTTRLVSSTNGAKDILNGITSIPPGAAIPLHFHNCEESVLVLSGRGTATIGEATTEVQQDDVTWLPAQVPHRFSCPSTASEALRIFWTYASADATRTIVETGETQKIDAEHER